MRKIFLSLIALTTFIVPTVGSWAKLPKGEHCLTHYYIVEPVFLMPVLIKHKDELNLTPEQKEKIKALIREIKPKAVYYSQRIDELVPKIRRDLIFNPDKKMVEDELTLLADLKIRKSLLNYECIQALRKILTEEQFKKLLQYAGIH
ncbi:MAG: hypothetical protein ABGX24_03405 [Aquificota bacterium]|jgi:hypothetical protein